MKVTLPNGFVVEGTQDELNPLLGIAAGAIAPKVVKTPVAVPKTPSTNGKPVKALTLKMYDTLLTIRDYGEAIMAPQVAVLMGITNSQASGRINQLKRYGLVEQVGSYRKWRLTAKAESHHFVAMGV